MHAEPSMTAGTRYRHELRLQHGVCNHGCTWWLHLRPQRAVHCWALPPVQVAMPAEAWHARPQAPDAAHEQLHQFWLPPGSRPDDELSGHDMLMYSIGSQQLLHGKLNTLSQRT